MLLLISAFMVMLLLAICSLIIVFLEICDFLEEFYLEIKSKFEFPRA